MNPRNVELRVGPRDQHQTMSANVSFLISARSLLKSWKRSRLNKLVIKLKDAASKPTYKPSSRRPLCLNFDDDAVEREEGSAQDNDRSDLDLIRLDTSHQYAEEPTHAFGSSALGFQALTEASYGSRPVPTGVYSYRSENERLLEMARAAGIIPPGKEEPTVPPVIDNFTVLRTGDYSLLDMD